LRARGAAVVSAKDQESPGARKRLTWKAES
jgi:hypothetical protein